MTNSNMDITILEQLIIQHMKGAGGQAKMFREMLKVIRWYRLVITGVWVFFLISVLEACIIFTLLIGQ